jgi:hypothetical protein
MDVIRSPWTSRTAFLIVAAAVCAGCSQVFTRGLIDDGHGNPVGGAQVRVLDATGAPLALDLTNSYGCFLISARAPKGAKRYTIDVVAPGFKPVRQDFPLAADVLIGALASSSAPDESRLHVASPSERSDRWIPNCAPPLTMGSDALTPK